MTHRLTMVATALASTVLVLAGCGSQGETPADAGNGPSGAEPVRDRALAAQQDQRSRAENMIADCMKQQGFTYVPHVPVASATPSSPSIRGQHPAMVAYEDLRTFRQKYGFGIYAADVYPQDPNVASRQSTTTTPNPNEAVKAGLDPAAKEAYNKALHGVGKGNGGCVNDSMKAVFGDTPTDDAAKQAEARQAQLAFESDASLIQAANAYATCLSSRGHKVSSTKPGMIEASLRQALVVARSQGNLTGDAARTALDNEIHQAMDDLECGKDYFVAAKPFVTKLHASGVG